MSWSDVGGYASLKDRLKRLVNGSFEHRQDFARLGIKPPSGILLYGPSGCGKSHVVSALVSSVPLNFVTAKCHDLFSKYLGESEEYIRSLFKLARRLSPSVLFLDQIEVLGGKREWAETGTTGVNERVLSTLLNEMDGVESSGQVIVVAVSFWIPCCAKY